MRVSARRAHERFVRPPGGEHLKDTGTRDSSPWQGPPALRAEKDEADEIGQFELRS
jgi:hypothetical protein